MKKIFFAISFILISDFLFSHGHIQTTPKQSPTVQYHGRRMSPASEIFYVDYISNQIDYDNSKNESLWLTIRFSVPIDPRTINSNGILINNQRIKNTKINYNKAGNVIRIRIYGEEYQRLKRMNYFSLGLYGLRSFDGQSLENENFINIIVNSNSSYFPKRQAAPKAPPSQSDSYTPKAPPKQSDSSTTKIPPKQDGSSTTKTPPTQTESSTPKAPPSQNDSYTPKAPPSQSGKGY